jgi:hypothetical protein
MWTRLSIVLAAIFLLGTCAWAQDIEPNDTPGNATPLALPYMSGGGRIGGPVDVDYYKFNLRAGQEVTIWVQTASLGSDLSAVVALYNSEGHLLAYNDKEFNLGYNAYQGDPILYIKVPETGLYYAAVTSVQNFYQHPVQDAITDGPYWISLFTIFDTVQTGDRYEPNDTRAAAKPITLPFDTYGAHLIYFGDMDWYQFTAKKGERVTLDVDALEHKGEQGWDLVAKTKIGLFDDSGKLLAESTADKDPDSGFMLDPTLTYSIVRDGKYYVAVTSARDPNFTTAFKDGQFLTSPGLSSTKNDIGYYELHVHASHDLWFPQIANGSFGGVYFTTSLLLVNYSSLQASGHVEFYNSDGSPMLSTFVPGQEPSNSAFFSIPPHGNWVVKTDGAGSGTSGYAILRSSVRIGGSVVFSQHDSGGALMTEAGVPAATGMDFFTFPVDVTGGFNTGVAVANLGNDRTVNLFCKLLNQGGQTVQTRTVSLEPGKHMATFVSGAGQLFPSVTNFRGSLQIFADSPVPAVALRSSENTLTTLPATNMNQASQAVALYFPQVVAGRGNETYRSTIILTNPGYFPTTGTIRFNLSNGGPMALDVEGRVAATHSFTVPPLGTVFLESTAPAELETGYAVLTADHGVGGVIIYSQYSAATGKLQTEVGVGAATPYSKFCLFAESEGEYNTGIAVANISTTSSELDYSLRPASESAETLNKENVTFAPGTQQAVLIAGKGQIFPAFEGNGNLEVTASSAVPAVALRITATSMTALPVIPIP